MTTRNPYQLSRNEIAAARARQQLRWNPETGSWQVFTFANAQTLEFKWFHVASEKLRFYRDDLKLPVVPYVAETAPPTVSATSESTPTKETDHDHSTP